MNVRVIEKSKKKKHSSAKAKAKSLESKESWDKLLSKWDVKPQPKKKVRETLSRKEPEHRKTEHHKSVDTRSGDTQMRKVDHYSGTDMIGIAVLHKSISTPIFKKEDAIAVAQMRR